MRVCGGQDRDCVEVRLLEGGTKLVAGYFQQFQARGEMRGEEEKRREEGDAM